eukprot:CAMPEP_0185774910 /NCGR_PEP_ID=MMETSP1174-20130828/80403_1 /TAXON_ID=35687 /ORGANISM="Dictyocha speculum, Strain CCMP1381" /LENGTH=269 /DNA_ID=CAMNT_0028462309 /DNA_START=9 /DNA_END=818 /DNA_ORIENTATION=-
MPKDEVSFVTALLSGGVAGMSVDIALFPLDTIKTRLQAPQGFFRAGGFKGIYNGLSAAAIGSAPGAAIFFCTYEKSKQFFSKNLESAALAQMSAASLAEGMACMVRVPTEVVKQRMQIGVHKTVRDAATTIMKVEGPIGFFSGFGITVLREVPFSAIQFPIYEFLKKKWASYKGRAEPLPYESAAFGSAAGGFAAAVTCPLDVVKTRLMLKVDAQGVAYKSSMDVCQRIIAEEGYVRFFSGIQPRVMWISIGGFVFFGAYEGAKSMLMR